MTEPINPLVVDLSHWDPAEDYEAAKEAGLAAVIYKATEGADYHDPTYTEQRKQAQGAGLLWGSYHFANDSDVADQANNYLDRADPNADELICLDWEDNGDDTMRLDQVKEWIKRVENGLGRPGQVVIYSGNTAKDILQDTVDEFLGKRRLWLAHYTTNPTVQASWDDYWLWQYTDGIYGPGPQTFPGLDPAGVDVNSYPGTRADLAAEWAGHMGPVPRPPRPIIVPDRSIVRVDITAPPGIPIKVVRHSRQHPPETL